MKHIDIFSINTLKRAGIKDLQAEDNTVHWIRKTNFCRKEERQHTTVPPTPQSWCSDQWYWRILRDEDRCSIPVFLNRGSLKVYSSVGELPGPPHPEGTESIRCPGWVGLPVWGKNSTYPAMLHLLQGSLEELDTQHDRMDRFYVRLLFSLVHISSCMAAGSV